jgi:ubiquinone/menaquinone biosynthesis C-methylase UbiE
MAARSARRPWGFAGWRWELLSDVRGPTLELGCGWGHNFAHYPPAATLSAFDLAPARVRAARQRAGRLRAPVRLSVGDAEHLAWPERTFETVAGTLVFCSIPHPDRALAEVRRVLRPGGCTWSSTSAAISHGWPPCRTPSPRPGTGAPAAATSTAKRRLQCAPPALKSNTSNALTAVC